MTTTFSAIRTRFITTIESLVPTRLASERFRRMQLGDQTIDMVAVAAQTELTAALFRMFQIRDNHDDQPTHYTDLHTVRVSHTMSLDVCYPKLWGAYGRRDFIDADDLIREDFHQIDRAIGIVGAANWDPAQSLSDNRGSALIDAGPALVRRSIYQVEFDKELGP
ncbi:MAG TPA: hypothetical protein VK607_10725 [Kofleriaceae bacterium]|nr:hypothetical protein [Kofleriaceae bacterium]